MEFEKHSQDAGCHVPGRLGGYRRGEPGDGPFLAPSLPSGHDEGLPGTVVISRFHQRRTHFQLRQAPRPTSKSTHVAAGRSQVLTGQRHRFLAMWAPPQHSSQPGTWFFSEQASKPESERECPIGNSLSFCKVILQVTSHHLFRVLCIKARR